MDSVLIKIGSILLAALPAIISGIFLYQFNKQKKAIDEKEEDKAQYEYSCMESLNALFTICKELYVISMHGRTPNGELEEAFKYMQTCKHNLEDYLRKLASKK